MVSEEIWDGWEEHREACCLANEDAGVRLARPGTGDESWEWAWAPYTQEDYRAALAFIHSQDVVLDIGAGDLRFAIRAAKIAKKVYSIEVQDALLDEVLDRRPLPENLILLRGDARHISFPAGISVGILLMRHCNHFRLYADRLLRAGADRLVTNARWGLDVEVIDLCAPRFLYQCLKLGWFACWCGNVGFKPGPAEQLTPELGAVIHEVSQCPACIKAPKRLTVPMQPQAGRFEKGFSNLLSNL